METKKSKVFTKKLIALFLSVLMALSCFTGALTAFAASSETDKKYNDSNLGANFMAWAETTDEQTAEALLDYADLYIGDLLSGLLGSDHLFFSQNVVVATIKIDAYLDSVDGLFDLLDQAYGLLNSYGNIVGGDVKNVKLGPIHSLSTVNSGEYVVSKCGKSYRGANSAKEMIMALAEVLYLNSNDFAGKNVLGQFVKGKLNLGSILEKVLKGDVYSLLQNGLGMWDNYQNDLAYNIVANLVLTKTKWFEEPDSKGFTKDDYLNDVKNASNNNNNRTKFNFDDVLFDALNRELIQKVSVLVTYPTFQKGKFDKDGNPVSESSYTRAQKMHLDASNGPVVTSSGVVYTDEFLDKDNVPMNVYLFQYDFNGNGTIEANEKLSLDKDTDTLFSFAFKALKFAWNTVLKDTVNLLHVNNSTDRGTGGNFDNQYYYWVTQQDDITWDTENWRNNYTYAKVKAWADDVWENYSDCKIPPTSAEDFLDKVRHTFDYDRNLSPKEEGESHSWKDINPETLFAKLRYSPLADITFGMQTGPINLYFVQTGISNLETFFSTAFTTYDNMVAGLNDALVAATKDIFINSDNIGYGSTGDQDHRSPAQNLTVPNMGKTNNTINNETIATQLVSNFMAMFEYAANAADPHIMAPYYESKHIATLGGNLSENVMEEAMIPLLIACVNMIDMTEPIHDEKWDSCADAEGVAIVALEEYLSFVLPDKDYTSLWRIVDGKIVANEDSDLFNGAILPMARDAISYLIQSVVPCRGADNQPWDVYTRPVNDSTTIFDILNSVVVYYASTVGYGGVTTNSKGVKINSAGKAVASLLGAVDGNGNCLVTPQKTLWQNIDAIANKLLPVLGTFQYGTVGAEFNSEDLFMNDIINGILNIKDKHQNNKQGITNILMKIITIVTAPPISDNNCTGTHTTLPVMIYDLLADEINTVFGARYDGQGYKKVVPNSEFYNRDNYDNTKSSTPFDSLVTVGTLGYYSATAAKDNGNGDGYSTGVLGILICNIFEAFGGGSYTAKANTAKIWTGAMFAVEAVNNFIPSFVPQLADHTFGASTAKIDNPSQASLTPTSNTTNSSFTPTTISITNNSLGLNRFYRDSDGVVNQLGRYFIKVKSIVGTPESGKTNRLNAISANNRIIAPGKTAKFDITGNAPTSTEKDVTYTFTVTYDVYMAKEGEAQTSDNTVFSNLKATTYMYLTTEQDWQDTVYGGTSDDLKIFSSNISIPGNSSSNTYVHSTAQAAKTGGFMGIGDYKSWTITYPNDYIIKMSDPDASTNNAIRIITATKDKSLDGLYTYLTAGQEIYLASGGAISNTASTSTEQPQVGYAAIDPENGDMLNYNFYDYSTNGGKSWIQKDQATYYGAGSYHGFTEDELLTKKAEYDTAYANATEEQRANMAWTTRYHVVMTLDFALQNMGDLVYGVQRTKSASGWYYDAVLLNLGGTKASGTMNGSSESVNTLLLKIREDGGSGNYSQDSISWGTPTAGLYYDVGKRTIGDTKPHWVRFLKYDGITELQPQSYDLPINGFVTYDVSKLKSKVKLTICDDTASNDLRKAFNEAQKVVASYSKTDVDSSESEEGDYYDNMQNTLQSAVQTMGTPIRADNADKMGSTMETVAVTEKTTNRLHRDEAYQQVPATTELPGSMQASMYKINGYWYADAKGNVPLYKNVKLTTATAGVVEVGDDGLYHLVNAPSYEGAWDTTTYNTPYWYETNKQETRKDGDRVLPVYKEISFVYRDANGNKVTSSDNWVYKVAETTQRIVPNTANPLKENRSVFQQQADNLNYRLGKVKDNIKASFASTIGVGVSEDRVNLNNVNYEIAAYEKMVQIAKNAEKLIWTKDYKLAKENPDAENGVYNVKVYWNKDTDSWDYIQTDTVAGEEVEISRTQYFKYDKATNMWINKNDDLVKDPDLKNDYDTNHSALEIDVAKALYDKYKGFADATIRPYMEGNNVSTGKKLEEEIICASGNAYSTMSVTPVDKAVAGVDYEITAPEAEYGKIEDGKLVNDGYTADSWCYYIWALGNAINTAKAGHGEGEGNTKVSNLYTVRTELMRAENALTLATEEEQPGGDTITITGQIVIATNTTGTQGNIGINDINILVGEISADDEEGVESVATSATVNGENGMFTAVVPKGTTVITISGPSTVNRYVTLSGEADVEDVVIPVVICDYNKDLDIDIVDKGTFGGTYNKPSSYDPFCDFNQDGEIDIVDKGAFGGFMNRTVSYEEMPLD